MRLPGVAPGGNSLILYFNCEGCAVEESRAVAAGGHVFEPKFSIGQYGFVSLPPPHTEGNLFGLHSFR